jgi:hypothetical protein
MRKSDISTPIIKKNILDAHFDDQQTLAEPIKAEVLTQS